jgi:hypothetical protein
MVKSRNEEKESILDMLQRQSEEIDKMHKIVATRYYVDEVTPSTRQWDGYDTTWTQETAVVVSPYFTTKENAEEWLGEHEPDEGKKLRVMKQHKRRTITETWWSAIPLRSSE